MRHFTKVSDERAPPPPAMNREPKYHRYYSEFAISRQMLRPYELVVLHSMTRRIGLPVQGNLIGVENGFNTTIAQSMYGYLIPALLQLPNDRRKLTEGKLQIALWVTP